MEPAIAPRYVIAWGLSAGQPMGYRKPARKAGRSSTWRGQVASGRWRLVWAMGGSPLEREQKTDIKVVRGPIEFDITTGFVGEFGIFSRLVTISGGQHHVR